MKKNLTINNIFIVLLFAYLFHIYFGWATSNTVRRLPEGKHLLERSACFNVDTQSCDAH